MVKQLAGPPKRELAAELPAALSVLRLPCAADELLDLPPVSPDEPLVTPVVAKHIMGQAAVQLAVLAGLVLHGEVRSGERAGGGEGPVPS